MRHMDTVKKGGTAPDGADRFGNRPPASVEVHIDELVLHGFAAGERYAIADAIEAELTRLLASEVDLKLPRKGLSVERLNGGAFHLASGAPGRVVGAQVAHAVHRSLSLSGTDSYAKSGTIEKGPTSR